MTTVADAAGTPAAEIQRLASELERLGRELHDARTELASSRDRIAELYDLAPVAYLTLGRDGAIQDANRAAAALLGLDRERLPGARFDRFVAQESLDTLQHYLHAASAGERTCDLRLIRADGSSHWARLEPAGPVTADAPAHRFMLGILAENGEAALANKDRWFRALIEKTSEFIAVLDADGTIVDRIANENNSMGYSNEELIGLNAFDLVHPEDLPETLSMFRSLLGRPGGMAQTEIRVRASNGAWHWLQVMGSNLLGEPAVAGIVLNSRDISVQKRTERALRENEARLNRSQEIAHLGSWELDLMDNSLTWSDETYRILGLQPGAVRPSFEAMLDRVHPDDRRIADETYARSIREGLDGYECEYRIVRRDSGEIRHVHAKCEHVRDGAGRVVRSMGMNRDITEQKLAQAALQDADRRKDEFLAMLAHELRNPLTPISLAAHILEQPGLSMTQQRWASTTISDRVEHITRLVDDLLDVSRISRGRIELKLERVDFAVLAAQAAESVRPTFEAKQQQFNLRLPGRPVYLEADPVRLTQVLTNLLDNAAKYTPERGHIEFAARIVGDEIEATVRDDGLGMRPDLLPHVFDLFRQGERTLDRSQGGLGIGLSLVERLVAMHGGRVEAASRGPGWGSVFTVRLPIPAEAPPARSQEPAAAPARMRVLVVDDDRLVAYSLGKMLKLHGHSVRIVASGDEALAMVAEFRPEAVLLDIGLVGMDGYETARRLRALPGGDYRLVAVSGYGDATALARSREAGFDAHLVKPVDYRQIAEELGRAA